MQGRKALSSEKSVEEMQEALRQVAASYLHKVSDILSYSQIEKFYDLKQYAKKLIQTSVDKRV